MRGVIAIALAVGCSHKGGPGVDGGLGSGSTWGLTIGSPAVAFVFNQQSGEVYRFQDVTGDGDYDESGERAVFFQASASPTGFQVHPHEFWALDGNTLLAVNNSHVGGGGGANNILWLQDMNGNGNALDAGELHVWFSGTLPGNTMVNTMTSLTRGPDGAMYVIDDPGNGPQTIYRMQDANGDGTVNDPGEVTVVGQVPANIFSLNIAVDPAGAVWLASGVEPESLYRMQAGAPVLQVDAALLQSQRGIHCTPSRLVALPDGSIVFSGTYEPVVNTIVPMLGSVRDRNNDGVITLDEVQMIWSLATGDFYSTFDEVRVLEDGSLIAADTYGNPTIRMLDLNGDGAFLEHGETYVTFDQTFASWNGQAMFTPSAMTASTK